MDSLRRIVVAIQPGIDLSRDGQQLYIKKETRRSPPDAFFQPFNDSTAAGVALIDGVGQ